VKWFSNHVLAMRLRLIPLSAAVFPPMVRKPFAFCTWDLVGSLRLGHFEIIGNRNPKIEWRLPPDAGFAFSTSKDRPLSGIRRLTRRRSTRHQCIKSVFGDRGRRNSVLCFCGLNLCVVYS